MLTPFKPELLSPAGTLKSMRYAFAYGADAIYAGQPRYSMRARNNEFNHQNLALGISEAHQAGKKFYVVVNIAPHNSKLKTFLHDLAPVIEMQPDALIISDPGLIMLVRETFPEMPLHLSVQSNTVNWAAVQFWQKMGMSRIILSRELSLEEIGEIRIKVPDMELEIFVHGALCMAYSGRCLLSGYLTHRDANQGTCTNACRWQYNIQQGAEDECGNIVQQEPAQSHQLPKHQPQIYQPPLNEPVIPTLGVGPSTNKLFIVQESERPEEPMTAFEDEHGTYIMNSRDLRAIQHVETLTKMGIHSLKIEGRTKSFYYVARTAQLYRQAIDDAVAGRPFNARLLTDLESLAHRGYTEGFLRRHAHADYQNYQYGYSVSDQQQFVGEFTGEQRHGLAEVKVKNRFLCGDQVEVMTPKGNFSFTLEHIENKQGQAITTAPGDGHTLYLSLPQEISLEHALLMRNLEGTTTRNPYQNTQNAQA